MYVCAKSNNWWMQSEMIPTSGDLEDLVNHAKGELIDEEVAEDRT